ncbi:monothiol glutaredoxin-s3 [Phtheirospermum japonicum]|uniref:Monothiol glutaredoxin-s3 n=1 Tax=Phtheirospermum japonicum TaxID=374723 RepID=A0A830D8C7_9LAMI|nr:monothiol glutaredoxin-s3 [Phtheirospermum japonicum]
MVSNNPVVIFSKRSCCISHTVRSLISELGVNPMVCELDEIARGSEIERALSQLGCSPTVPAVYIGGEFVGGANQVVSLHLSGSLKPKLINAGALWL